MHGAAAGPDALIELLERSAAYDDGEDVDLRAHGLQCAALLAGAAPGDVELQVAGLVHDLGWVLDPSDEAGHAARSARLVRPVLGERVAWLVAHHVDAKRYLVSTEPAYAERLSRRSRVTLEAQGGLLPAAAQRRLRAAPSFEALLELRRADDSAKDPGCVVPGLDAWRPRLVELSRRR